PNPKCGPFDLKRLWQDSLRRGLFARALGKQLGMKDAEDLFAAALLQDMAIPLLANELPQQYEDLLKRRQDGEFRLTSLEEDAFGWNHGQAAAEMSRSWSLPEEFSVLIQAHGDLETAIADVKTSPGTFSVAVSSLLPAANDDMWHDRDRFVSAYQAACPDGAPLEELFATIDAQFEEFAPVLKVGSPAKTLVECLQAEAAPA
ncbi:MAG: HDOD domain-containing protein, partial [Planctomycetales bacterium]|nr:HDOD domain-containing protein [Planctomycetales bacterium]